MSAASVTIHLEFDDKLQIAAGTVNVSKRTLKYVKFGEHSVFMTEAQADKLFSKLQNMKGENYSE